MNTTPRPGRRTFLAATGTAAAAGAAVVATTTSTPAPETAPQKTADAPLAKGYRLSDHVRKYYDTTRV